MWNGAGSVAPWRDIQIDVPVHLWALCSLSETRSVGCLPLIELLELYDE